MEELGGMRKEKQAMRVHKRLDGCSLFPVNRKEMRF